MSKRLPFWTIVNWEIMWLSVLINQSFLVVSARKIHTERIAKPW